MGPDRGTVYGARRRDWLVLGAAGFLVVAVLVAVIFIVYGRQAPHSPTSTPRAGSPVPPSPTPTPSPSPSPVLSGVPAEASLLRAKQTALCLDVRADVEPEGAPTIQAPCSAAAGQKWTPAPTGAPDTYTFTNLASGKCLDINGESRDDSAVALQWTCKGSANQQWKAVPVGDGYALVSVNSGKCLSGAGTGVVQLPCTGEPTQVWSFATT